eukprot:jgi/Chrzof1/2184/Cz11g05100.t1
MTMLHVAKQPPCADVAAGKRRVLGNVHGYVHQPQSRYSPHVIRKGRAKCMPSSLAAEPSVELFDSSSAHAAQSVTAVPKQSTRAVSPGFATDYNLSGLNGLSVNGTEGLDKGMFTVSSSMPVHYTVKEVTGIFDLDNKSLLRGVLPNSFPFALGPEPAITQGLRRMIVIDETVNSIYGDKLRQYLDHHGVEYMILPLPTCEENKTFDLVFQIADAIETFKINRRQDPIIAIGGGVCLDVTGLAANLYRRNTSIIKVPTTLMATVDASIGIKTAVNFHDKKNKLGTYCPPLGVFYDLSFLQTLEARHLSNGSAEILKMACIKDEVLFQMLEQHADDLLTSHYQVGAAQSIIRRAIQGMLEELEYNLWEHILMRLVDYGHTVSPEIEMAALRCEGMLLHGEAVNIDMALSTELSYQRGLLTKSQRDRVFRVMEAFNLPVWHQVCSVDLFMKGIDDMTRARDGMQRTPLMSGIGGAIFANDLTRAEISTAAHTLQCIHADRLAKLQVQKEPAVNNIIPLNLPRIGRLPSEKSEAAATLVAST